MNKKGIATLTLQLIIIAIIGVVLFGGLIGVVAVISQNILAIAGLTILVITLLSLGGFAPAKKVIPTRIAPLLIILGVILVFSQPIIQLFIAI